MVLCSNRFNEYFTLHLLMSNTQLENHCQVKIRFSMLSYKNYYLTILCLLHHFGTIFTIFAKFKYCFEFD